MLEASYSIAPENILLMRTSGVTEKEYLVVENAVREVVALSQASITVHSLGNWAMPGFENNPWLVAHNSADGYAMAAYNTSFEAVIGEKLFKLFIADPYQKNMPSMKILVTEFDILVEAAPPPEIMAFGANCSRSSFGGMAIRYLGAVISVSDYRVIENLDYGKLNNTSMHETAHLLGVPGKNRRKLDSGERHCINDCIMQAQSETPIRTDTISGKRWVDVAASRRRAPGLCKECLHDLRMNPMLPRKAICL